MKLDSNKDDDNGLKTLNDEKLKSLQSGLFKQGLLTLFSRENDSINEASFLLAWDITHTKRPYGEGELILIKT